MPATRTISMSPAAASKRLPRRSARSRSFTSFSLWRADFLNRPGVLGPQHGPSRLFPGAHDHARSRGDRGGKPLFEDRPHGGKEFLVVLGVVRVFAGRSLLVGLEERIDEAMAGEQHVKGGVAR